MAVSVQKRYRQVPNLLSSLTYPTWASAAVFFIWRNADGAQDAGPSARYTHGFRPGSVGTTVLLLNTVSAGVAGFYAACQLVPVTLAGSGFSVALAAWYLWSSRRSASDLDEKRPFRRRVLVEGRFDTAASRKG